jgi:CheY-like chemotaxis protein
VDDEPDLRDVIRKLLENFHFRVDEAAHGGEAAEKYRAALQQSKPYDLVIMDLTMPVVDGRQAARTILELDPSARVIIATGRGGDRAEFQADIPGLAGILQKPFELTLLLQETTRALGENRRPGG